MLKIPKEIKTKIEKKNYLVKVREVDELPNDLGGEYRSTGTERKRYFIRLLKSLKEDRKWAILFHEYLHHLFEITHWDKYEIFENLEEALCEKFCEPLHQFVLQTIVEGLKEKLKNEN